MYNIKYRTHNEIIETMNMNQLNKQIRNDNNIKSTLTCPRIAEQ